MSTEPRKLQCDEAIRMLLEFLDNELEQHDHSAVEAHLHSCRSCFSRAEFDKRLRGMVRDRGGEPASAPGALRDRIKKIIDNY